MFKENSIWDEYIECYRTAHNGEFETDYDKNTYDCVVARRANLIPYNFKVLKSLGEPVVSMMTKETMRETSDSEPLTWTNMLS